MAEVRYLRCVLLMNASWEAAWEAAWDGAIARLVGYRY